ncbi:MAG: hypothetical protein LBT59_23870 [Clostridiales bacterium]|jgi:hypothetical protein|nr:hypothetical protein [Clostridiales bacterium]
MSKAGFIALVVVAAIVLIGSQVYNNSKIEVVKNASPVGHSDTYGRVFERAFTNTKWSHFHSTGYDSVIEFNGRDRSGNDVVIQIVQETLVSNRWIAMYISINDRSLNMLDIAPYIREMFDNY